MAILNILQAQVVASSKKLLNAVVPYWAQNSLPYRLFQNWIFQGIALMHWSELIYRFFLELLLLIIVSTWFLEFYSLVPSLIFSFVIVHTLMWTFNGHFWALHISKKIRLVRNNPKKIRRYLNSLEQRINNNQSVEGCIIFGSLTRGKFHEYSDLDIVFSKKDGFRNALSAYSVGVKERFLAFIYRIPIELYFYDSNAFSNTEKGEIPLLIKDDNNKWQKKVSISVWLSDYSLLSKGFFES